MGTAATEREATEEVAVEEVAVEEVAVEEEVVEEVVMRGVGRGMAEGTNRLLEGGGDGVSNLGHA